MGTGNIGVGKTPSTRKSGQPLVKRLLGSDLPELRIDNQNPLQNPLQNPSQPLRADRKVCGAMAEQRGDSGRGHQSAPQKLVHLVGCRESNGESKTRSESEARPEFPISPERAKRQV
ncbi:hypothetical protein [Bradyrhizobium canariense]|uniref:Uncharacterized protein n=1 Tax=Bradyrhizobium canariense TaxID=255045 RepID=A0A1H1RCY9_9BRAD|nr:hypothetical protein [Bradyrhizobium canariense]SDS33558.1 hypothetical protein SAMN05444158_1739 [Bradyrhizobium canariense]